MNRQRDSLGPISHSVNPEGVVIKAAGDDLSHPQHDLAVRGEETSLFFNVSVNTLINKKRGGGGPLSKRD